MLLNLLLKNFEKILIQANLLAHFLDCGHCVLADCLSRQRLDEFCLGPYRRIYLPPVVGMSGGPSFCS